MHWLNSGAIPNMCFCRQSVLQYINCPFCKPLVELLCAAHSKAFCFSGHQRRLQQDDCRSMTWACHKRWCKCACMCFKSSLFPPPVNPWLSSQRQDAGRVPMLGKGIFNFPFLHFLFQRQTVILLLCTHSLCPTPASAHANHHLLVPSLSFSWALCIWEEAERAEEKKAQGDSHQCI